MKGAIQPLKQYLDEEKDVGVTINSNLSFENHIQNQVNKANQIVGLTRHSVVYLDNRTFFFK